MHKNFQLKQVLLSRFFDVSKIVSRKSDFSPRSRRTVGKCVRNVLSERIANETLGTVSVSSERILYLFRTRSLNICRTVVDVRNTFEQRSFHMKIFQFRYLL